MDVNNTPQQGPARVPHPGMPQRPQQAMGRRPMVDGFAPRRPIQQPYGTHPGLSHRPAQPPLPHPTVSQSHPSTHVAAPRPIPVVQQQPHIAPPHPQSMAQPQPTHPQQRIHVASGLPPVHASAAAPTTHAVPSPTPQPRPAQPPQPEPFEHAAPTPPTHPIFGSLTRKLKPTTTPPVVPTPTPPTPAATSTPVATAVPQSIITPTPAPTPQTLTPGLGEQSASTARPAREKNRTGHAGWAGFVIFIVLTALLLSPFIPGKIFQDFPFASSTFSTGDSILDCLGTQGQLNTVTKYDSKAGSPITYRYSTSTTQSATCDGQSQSAVTGHASQLNPLGLVIDVLLSLAIAIGVSYIWRFIFGEKRHHPRGTTEEI